MNSTRGNDKLKAALKGQPQTNMTPTQYFRAKLEAGRGDLAAFLGSKPAVDRFVNTCMNAVLERPELLEADMKSLLTSCKRAANLGLKPDGREAVLNIYNTKVKDGGKEQWIKAVQLLPMVAGVVKMLYRGGATYVDAAAVYEADEFDFVRGDTASLTHRPSASDEPGKIVAAYAVVKTAGGEIKREVMFGRDLEKVRSKSKVPDKGPWVDWPDQMSIKSVLHRIRKQLDIEDDQLDRLLVADNEAAGYANTSTGQSSLSLELNPSQSARFDDPDLGHKEKEPVKHDDADEANAETSQDYPETTYPQVRGMIDKAQSIETLDLAIETIEAIRDPSLQDELRQHAEDRRKALQA